MPVPSVVQEVPCPRECELCETRIVLQRAGVHDLDIFPVHVDVAAVTVQRDPYLFRYLITQMESHRYEQRYADEIPYALRNEFGDGILDRGFAEFVECESGVHKPFGYEPLRVPFYDGSVHKGGIQRFHAG